MGTRAFSHDSIFIPDGRAESEESDQAMSQENILGKVKTLQQQLAKNIKFGQPPQMTVSVKASGEASASFEADVLLSSPMETETQQDTVLPETCNKASDTSDSLSPVSVPGTRHEAEEKVTPVKSSRPKRHHSPSGTIDTVNLDAIPLAIARLDNSAAKHKLAVKPKNQRVSKKHRRLSKELPSMIVSEFEQEIPELQKYEVLYHDGHHTADKSSELQEGKEQKTEGKRKQEDIWPNLETEKKIQMADADFKKHPEHKRLQEFGEGQREQEGKKQKLQVEEKLLNKDERKCPEEEKRHEDQRYQEPQENRHKGLEEQKKKEGGLPEWELQKQQAEEEEKHQEVGKQSEEGGHQELEVKRQQEEQGQQKLKEQEPQQEQRHPEVEAQRHQEEQVHQKPEVQRHQEQETQWQQADHSQALEEQRQQELEDQRRKEEKVFRELERKRQQGKLLPHKGDKRHEQEKKHLKETKLGHQERQRGQEMEVETQEAGKQGERSQPTSHNKQRQTGQKQERQRDRNLEGEKMLQVKMKLERHKRAEEQKRHLEEAMKSKEEPQEEPQRSMRSAEHGECGPAELKQPSAEKRVQQEELIEKEGGQKQDEQKTPALEVQPPLGQSKEQGKAFQLPLDKNIRLEEKPLEGVEKELPLKEEPRSTQKIKKPDKGEVESPSHHPRKGTEVQEQERILGEELRWQEVDARQAMPRGFTFQVSSGEKQILFPKVNLSPVTPVKEAPSPSATKEVKSPQLNKGPHAFPSSMCVPHTAILVTGAQLCGTAVNLNQIKDTACKSFLGLTEERKMADLPSTESTQKMSPEAKASGGKMKTPPDSLGNQAILAEWATIRSKILKGSENGKLNEKDKGSISRHSDDWAPKGRGASHSQLRKTLSANAKFSITPAWQKFSETSKANNVDVEIKTAPEAENTAKQMGPQPDANQEAVHPEAPACTANVLGAPTGKTESHHKVADNTEGCKFAKDLPSFLVPAAPHPPSKESSQPESLVAMESQQNVGVRKLDRTSPSGEENVSPFGVKLRRTNYSVRFHYDQQAEQKKKKRYSAGDSFDGVPTPLVSPNSEKDVNNTFLKDSTSPSQERKDPIVHSVKDSSVPVNLIQVTAAPVSLPSNGQVSAPKEKPVCRSPLPQKPALAPKPISQTPPSSPLSKMRRSHLTEAVGPKGAKMEPDTSWRKTEPKESSLLSHTQDASKNEEQESREKKSFFPSITMPWREKVEKKPEPLKKERPVLQSRHSIDGSKLMDKVETAQPLWITLALQKQKGFREQQATREERRQAREAKQAEKLAKENASINSQSENKNSHPSRTSAVLKPTVQDEEKKIETAISRLERREQLKKSNTLPTSVTVEISDSIPTSPLAKEVTKRFSTPDSSPVSTEPAWLALAKRKAKAWSDCPQIIK